jgi:hypothetical protein
MLSNKELDTGRRVDVLCAAVHGVEVRDPLSLLAIATIPHRND